MPEKQMQILHPPRRIQDDKRIGWLEAVKSPSIRKFRDRRGLESPRDGRGDLRMKVR
jgi:hypothetical protein